MKKVPPPFFSPSTVSLSGVVFRKCHFWFRTQLSILKGGTSKKRCHVWWPPLYMKSTGITSDLSMLEKSARGEAWGEMGEANLSVTFGDPVGLSVSPIPLSTEASLRPLTSTSYRRGVALVLTRHSCQSATVFTYTVVCCFLLKIQALLNKITNKSSIVTA